MKQHTKSGKRKSLQSLPQVEANAAGIDVGAREMFVAVPSDRDEEPVRVYRGLRVCLVNARHMRNVPFLTTA